MEKKRNADNSVLHKNYFAMDEEDWKISYISFIVAVIITPRLLNVTNSPMYLARYSCYLKMLDPDKETIIRLDICTLVSLFVVFF